MNKVCARLLISLDALLDTRSGTLFQLDQEASFRLLKSTYYAARPWDQFPGFDMPKFKEAYANRDKKVLKYSSMTNTVGIIQDFIQRVMNKNLNAPIEMDVEIHLNVYPYVLSDSEKHILTAALLAKLPLNPKIEVVSYSLEQLNPFFLKSVYSTLVIYDFFDWIEIHSKNELIKKHPIPEITVFSHALLKHKDETTPVNLAEQFTNVMLIMQPFVNLILLPIDVFTTIMANKPKRPTAPKDGEPEGDLNIDEMTEEELEEAKAAKPSSSA